jgi:hypothetical protein
MSTWVPETEPPHAGSANKTLRCVSTLAQQNAEKCHLSDTTNKGDGQADVRRRVFGATIPERRLPFHDGLARCIMPGQQAPRSEAFRVTKGERMAHGIGFDVRQTGVLRSWLFVESNNGQELAHTLSA